MISNISGDLSEILPINTHDSMLIFFLIFKFLSTYFY